MGEVLRAGAPPRAAPFSHNARPAAGPGALGIEAQAGSCLSSRSTAPRPPLLAAACLLLVRSPPARQLGWPPASPRRREAEASLRGEAGRGALVAVLRELVAQRCQMVCQLGAAFQLGPTQGQAGAHWAV